MHLSNDNKYLITYLIALFVLTLVLWFTSISFQTLNYILLGFCWNLTIHAPSLKEKLELKKYRFSLLRFVFGVDKFLSSFTHKFFLRTFLRSIPPVVLSFLCFLISFEGIFLASLFGSFFFELVFHRIRILNYIKYRREDL